MDIVSKTSLKEIDLLIEHLEPFCDIRGSNNKQIPNEILNQLQNDLNNDIWNSSTLEKCMTNINNADDNTVGYLWGDSSPQDLKKSISKSSFYLDEVIIDDPITIHLLETPFFSAKDRSDFMHDWFNCLVKSREWVESGILKIMPVSKKFWYENDEIKRIFDINVKKYGQDELDFITNQTNMIERFEFNTCAASKGSASYLNYLKHITDGIILETEQGIYFNKVLNTISTLNDYEQWRIYNWRLKKEKNKPSLNAKSVFTLQNLDLKYLDNIPLSIALKIRNDGCGAQLRDYFRDKFKDVNNTDSIEEFQTVTSDISTEINDELKIYEKDVMSLKDPLINICGKGAISILFMGISAHFGYSPLDQIQEFKVFATAMGYLGINEIQKIREKRKNPLNMLLEAKRL